MPAASVLSLPELFVNVEEGIAYGIVVQKWCGVQKPIAYISKLLNQLSEVGVLVSRQ